MANAASPWLQFHLGLSLEYKDQTKKKQRTTSGREKHRGNLEVIGSRPNTPSRGYNARNIDYRDLWWSGSSGPGSTRANLPNSVHFSETRPTSRGGSTRQEFPDPNRLPRSRPRSSPQRRLLGITRDDIVGAAGIEPLQRHRSAKIPSRSSHIEWSDLLSLAVHSSEKHTQAPSKITLDFSKEPGKLDLVGAKRLVSKTTNAQDSHASCIKEQDEFTNIKGHEIFAEEVLGDKHHVKSSTENKVAVDKSDHDRDGELLKTESCSSSALDDKDTRRENAHGGHSVRKGEGSLETSLENRHETGKTAAARSEEDVHIGANGTSHDTDVTSVYAADYLQIQELAITDETFGKDDTSSQVFRESEHSDLAKRKRSVHFRDSADVIEYEPWEPINGEL